ncbi:hypothetical protein CPS_4564 [Colwellia psychrerythraea 34H]|uniref:Uncharacterized protein n=1 Tax=Colwellia psychrerythraea (strain 34H / ATCC BAA-681) TaxID=167879 RepID=Q47VG0_COLP3|nr:hypothetical protein CPS_4564 [Colwellia psychrerythraea 34H]
MLLYLLSNGNVKSLNMQIKSNKNPRKSEFSNRLKSKVYINNFLRFTKVNKPKAKIIKVEGSGIASAS